jgi:hypothetical protein
MPDDRRVTGGTSAANRLSRLKRQGCNLLVTGAASDRAANRATRRLFGAADLDRTRVLVRTDPTTPVTALLPAAVAADAPSVTVVDVADAGTDTRDARPPSLVALGRTVGAAAADFAAGPEPRVGGEFRLAVTSLDRLVADHGVAAVGRFLARVTDAVTDVRGLGQYRLAGPPSALSALPLDRLFDGVVDLRDDDGPDHRVSFPTTASQESAVDR